MNGASPVGKLIIGNHLTTELTVKLTVEQIDFPDRLYL
jgi:hypothetical protein